MTSTRNKNTITDYALEQASFIKLNNERLYINSAYGRPLQEHYPTIGYTPSHMSRDTFSNNPIEIESQLFGIGSSNLVIPCKAVNPLVKEVQFKDFFERKKETIMPQPLVYNNNQRPNLI